MRTRQIILLALLVGGCIPQTRVAPPPAPPPVLRPAPPPPAPAPLASDWRDWPLTPGDWHYRRTQFGSIASFGVANADPVLSLTCDKDRRVRLVRTPPGTGALTIRTTSVTRLVQIEATQPPGAAFAPNDPLLDAIGFSRGRFIVEQAGALPLVIPAWAEIERVTEDCRG